MSGVSVKTFPRPLAIIAAQARATKVVIRYRRWAEGYGRLLHFDQQRNRCSRQKDQ
jgi:hypothetical protein